jgi:hypothetical protein
MRLASLQKIKPLQGALIFLADSFDKRDSPTFCRPRFGLHAEPFESPTQVRRDFASLQKIKPLQGALIFFGERGIQIMPQNLIPAMIIKLISLVLPAFLPIVTKLTPQCKGGITTKAS